MQIFFFSAATPSKYSILIDKCYAQRKEIDTSNGNDRLRPERGELEQQNVKHKRLRQPWDSIVTTYNTDKMMEPCYIICLTRKYSY
jgi:hypothetical protein